MNFIGNIGWNHDRQSEVAGASPDGAAFVRRSSITDQDAEATQHAQSEGFLQRTISGLTRPNTARSATEKSTVPKPVPEERNHDYFSGEKGTEPAETPPSASESPDEKDREVAKLARTFTGRSNWSQVVENPFTAEKDTALDPNSTKFVARQWVKSMIKLNEAESTTPIRTAGVAFRNLNVHGYAASTDYQKDVGNILLDAVGAVKKVLGLGKPRRVDILRDFEGLVKSGEMLVVLGPPGSGCSTFLKTMTGEINGFIVDEGSELNYQGIPAKEMNKYFRGEAIYTAEVDVHFPMLSVGDTLEFAAKARAPKHIPGGLPKKEFATHLRDVVMATFGISHTINTRVGNDFVRGVSGGERKRVTIAEAILSGAPLQAWDNSTRGLDSANAIEFCKTVRIGTELGGAAAMVAIYQAPQSAYDIFDKAIVLYQGRQIYFGPTTEARAYFERLGFECPDRQTDADFLTSMTSPQERVVRKGFEGRTPRTPDDFAAAWKKSAERATLLQDIETYEKQHPLKGEAYDRFVQSRKAQKAKGSRLHSPFTLSYMQQVMLCLWRGLRRLAGDPSLTFTQLFGNFAVALILGSVFYNLQSDTASFFQRGALLFFAVLMNAFGSALEILTLYAQRPIVEKHNQYAFYHPSAEAFASMLTDLPYKVMNAIIFNITIYFMANLRREPGAFFFFLFISFILTLTMSMFFRTIASVSRSLAQAMAPAAILILALVIFTGFVIPKTYLLRWCFWIAYIDPISYGFESLMVNEFSGRNFPCSQAIPSYGNLALQQSICSTVGSVAGQDFVSGDAYINSQYGYYAENKWRNVGIIFAFMIGLMCIYLVAAEYISAKKSKGEVLLFRLGHKPASLKQHAQDEESLNDGAVLAKKQSYVEASDVIQKQTAVFSWRDVCYDIKIKSEERRILDHVDGWVKPGTLTALMGVSGAGKTTLLDVLATRVTMGVISGEMLVDGQQRDSSFQRKTGYVQQQDLHLQTSTVREALIFSAVLRQPAHVSRKEKVEYVGEVIRLLDMEEYADAVVGVPGEGLNVEQRKRLTIGIELVAKPELLLFLDEPTSGLDSQTSWAICDLMEKLTKSGQAILCTIHQPSAMLFQRFDRLLFLAKGGKTVYFGDVGENAKVLTAYFQRNGGSECPKDANPAEWMLEVIGAAPGTHTDIDWHDAWRKSPEYAEVHKELDRLRDERPKQAPPRNDKNDKANKAAYREFAAPFPEQVWETTYRVFQQYWRTPSYIYSKLALCVFSALFIGFIFFKAPLSQQGLQNQLLSIFMLFTVFGQLCQIQMPAFVTQRSLYEVRERPSKSYSWKAFMLAQLIVEIPWAVLCSVLMFLCFWFPVGLYNNAIPTNAVNERAGLFFLFVLQFLVFTSTFGTLVVAGMPDAETAGNIANLMFTLCLVFCGVLAPPTSLPGFWIFMYRVSPFTYLVEGMITTGLANQAVTCADNEYLTFQPSAGTCQQYMQPWIDQAGGYLQNPDATSDCSFCTISDTNAFLADVSSYYDNRWRDFGILWAFIIFNIGGAVLIYWLGRVPKGASRKKTEKSSA